MLHPGGALDSTHIRTYSPNPSKKQHRSLVPRTLAHVRVHSGRNSSQDLDGTHAHKINKSVNVNKLPTKPVLGGCFCALTQALRYLGLLQVSQWEAGVGEQHRHGPSAFLYTGIFTCTFHLEPAAPTSGPPSLWEPAPRLFPKETMCW